MTESGDTRSADFISHCGINNDWALRVRDWLVKNGWDDLFLDLDPERDLKAGERWQPALREAADHSEVVLFLVSRAWADSRWYAAEYLLTKQVGKSCRPILIEPGWLQPDALRLALSGTPIENHLGELWSLLELLNLGLLGTSTTFNRAGTGQTVDDETVALLARGLRPFILRRTKAQVASDRPAKTEQALYRELERPQRAL